MTTDDRSPESGSVYERVVVTAREAKRLNERHLFTRVTPRRKVTTEAIERVRDGEVEFRYPERAEKRAPVERIVSDGVFEGSGGDTGGEEGD